MSKKKRGKWIQKATAKMKKKGTLGSYGSHSEKEMDADIKKGGKLGKKALFAKNVRKGAKRRSKKSGKRLRKRGGKR